MLVISTIVLLNNGITIVRTIGFLLLFMSSLFLRVEDLLVLIIALEPVSILFKWNGSYTVIPFMFIVLFVKLGLKNTKVSLKKIIPLSALMLIGVLNYLFRGFGVAAYVSFFLPVLCLVYISENKNISLEKIFNKVIWLYVVSTLVECILSGVFPNAVKVVTHVSQYNVRNVGFSSEWDYGRHILTAISFVVYWLLKNKRNVVLPSMLVLYFISCLIETGLYSGLVALGGLVFMIPLTFDGTPKQRISYTVVGGIVILFVVVIAYYFVFLPMLELRGQISDNGRFELWRMYYNDFINSPSIMFFGIGAGAISEYAATIGRLTTHNIVIEKMFEFGIIGICLLVCLLGTCFSKRDLSIRKNLRLLPLITFLGTCLTQGTSGSELLFILMILGL